MFWYIFWTVLYLLIGFVGVLIFLGSDKSGRNKWQWKYVQQALNEEGGSRIFFFLVAFFWLPVLFTIVVRSYFGKC